jgi:hypothetical protein
MYGRLQARGRHVGAVRSIVSVGVVKLLRFAASRRGVRPHGRAPGRDLRPAGGAELAEDVGDVGRDRLRRHHHRSAICRLVRPAATSWATSNSRALSGYHGSAGRPRPAETVSRSAASTRVVAPTAAARPRVSPVSSAASPRRRAWAAAAARSSRAQAPSQNRCRARHAPSRASGSCRCPPRPRRTGAGRRPPRPRPAWSRRGQGGCPGPPEPVTGPRHEPAPAPPPSEDKYRPPAE